MQSLTRLQTKYWLARLHFSLELSSLPKSCDCCQIWVCKTENPIFLPAVSVRLFSASTSWPSHGSSHGSSHNMAAHFFNTNSKISLASNVTLYAESKFSITSFAWLGQFHPRLFPFRLTQSQVIRDLNYICNNSSSLPCNIIMRVTSHHNHKSYIHSRGDFLGDRNLGGSGIMLPAITVLWVNAYIIPYLLLLLSLINHNFFSSTRSSFALTNTGKSKERTFMSMSCIMVGSK